MEADANIDRASARVPAGDGNAVCSRAFKANCWGVDQDNILEKQVLSSAICFSGSCPAAMFTAAQARGMFAEQQHDKQ